MPVNLSIKNAPDEIVERLRKRAVRNHRSLQGELMAIIETAAAEERSLSGQGERRMTTSEILAEVRKLGIRGKAGESVAIIRESRDSR